MQESFCYPFLPDWLVMLILWKKCYECWYDFAIQGDKFILKYWKFEDQTQWTTDLVLMPKTYISKRVNWDVITNITMTNMKQILNIWSSFLRHFLYYHHYQWHCVRKWTWLAYLLRLIAPWRCSWHICPAMTEEAMLIQHTHHHSGFILAVHLKEVLVNKHCNKFILQTVSSQTWGTSLQIEWADSLT